MNRVMATPAARRAAQERGVELVGIMGTGESGYIQLSDVPYGMVRKATPLAKAYVAYYKLDISDIDKSGLIRKSDVLHFMEEAETSKPLSGMRRVIAQRMEESMDTAPQYTTHASVCAHELKKLLDKQTKRSQERGEVKPTYSDLLIRAAALALRDNMLLNSSFTDNQITIHRDINIGLAVALEDGLIVPNIKNADKKTLAEITAERKRLVDRARAGKLLPEEYTGGTFTISNMGGFPVEYFTPIINLPESAILGVGAIMDKVVPVDGNIGIRPMMGLSLTSDHRHIDGAVSGKYIKRLKEIIENPESIISEESHG